MKRFLEKYYKILIVIILGFMLAVSLFNARNESAIFDETAHIGAAYSYLDQHDMRLNPEHPPLIKDLSAIPLKFLDLNFDTTQKYWTEDVNGQWDAGKTLLYHSGNDADQILFWSRFPIVLLSILLGLFIFKWTRELAGIGAGMLALALYAFNPNILGHNHYVTTDLGIAAFITFSFYYFLRFIKEPSWKNVFLGGFFLGLLQLAKFSSILIFPIFGLILLIYPLVIIKKRKDISEWSFRLKSLGAYLGKGIVAFLFSLIIVWGVYWINTYDMPESKLVQTINFYLDSQLKPSGENFKDVYTNQALVYLAKNPITKPLSEYILGIAMVFKRVAGGNGAYFMEQVSSTAFPAYFPTVFLIKEPIPSLFLMTFAFLASLASVLVVFSRQIRHGITKFPKELWQCVTHYLRTHIVTFSLFLFILLYAYTSITGNLNIGFRHLFPILPFAFILTAKIIASLIKKMHNKHNEKIVSIVLGGLLVFLIIETVSAYPYYMSYFNPLAGGPKNGYHYVTDSNADWGQDLKRLKSFLDQHPEIDKIRVDYFGGGDVKYYLGEKYLMWWDSKRPVEKGWYAISTNFLQGSLYDTTKKEEESYRFLKNKNPRYQVGTSILIYYLNSDDLKNIK